MKRLWIVGVAALVCMSASPSFAKFKHAKAHDHICHNKALSMGEEADCEKQMSDAKTADERAKVNKTFKEKVNAVQAAQAALPGHK